MNSESTQTEFTGCVMREDVKREGVMHHGFNHSIAITAGDLPSTGGIEPVVGQLHDGIHDFVDIHAIGIDDDRVLRRP